MATSNYFGKEEVICFFARPRPDVVVQATERKSLEEILNRMKNKPETRVLPADIPEWRHLDPESDLWIIRHYDRIAWTDDPDDELATDPTSPFNPKGNGFDPSAIGLCVSASQDDTDLPKVIYLSGNEHAVEVAESSWNPEWMKFPGVRSKVEERQPGVIEITHPLDTDDADLRYTLLLYLHLGHLIIL